jgi:hypothetical protein
LLDWAMCLMCLSRWLEDAEGGGVGRGFSMAPPSCFMPVVSSDVRKLCHVSSVHVLCSKPYEVMLVVSNVANE